MAVRIDIVTYRRLFEKELGKSGVKKLPETWKRHIDRIDSLPRAKKRLSPKEVLEVVGA